MERKYEILFLLKPNISDSLIEKFIQELENKFFHNKRIIKKEDWGLKKLAYKIEKFEEAKYLLYYVLIDSEKIKEFKKFLFLKKEVLRFMLIKHDKKWPFEMKTTKNLEFSTNRKLKNRQINSNQPLIQENK